MCRYDFDKSLKKVFPFGGSFAIIHRKPIGRRCGGNCDIWNGAER